MIALEGLHAVKHAARFGAALSDVRVADRAAALALAAELAPDLTPVLAAAEEVGEDAIRAAAAGRSVPTGVLAFADAPRHSPADVLAADGVVVLLDRPRAAGNAGAAIRVAAAAGAAGILVTGELDPWHPICVRGAAGLQFAQPVARVDGALPDDLGGRPLVAVHPDGSVRIGEDALLAGAVLAFGTERGGLDRALLRRADAVARIPMRQGVSSLNLATAVAVTLYAPRAEP